MTQPDQQDRAHGIAVRTQTQMQGGALAPTNAEQLWYVCQRIASGRIAIPQDLQGKADACFTVAVIGGELGFSLMQSLQNISIIRGRATLPGQMVSALVRTAETCQLYKHGYEGKIEDGTRLAWIESRRKGDDIVRTEYGLADAKRAGLWPGKDDSGWRRNPDDMLHWRAVGRDGRQNWSDRLLGVDVREVLADTPAVLEAEVVGQAGALPSPDAPDPALAALDAQVEGDEVPAPAEPADEPETAQEDPEAAAEGPVVDAGLPYPGDEGDDPFDREEPGAAIVCAKCELPIARGDVTVTDAEGTFHESCRAEPASEAADPEVVDQDGTISAKQASTLKAEITKRSKKFLPQHQEKAAKTITAAVLKKAQAGKLEELPAKFYDKAVAFIRNAKVDPS